MNISISRYWSDANIWLWRTSHIGVSLVTKDARSVGKTARAIPLLNSTKRLSNFQRDGTVLSLHLHGVCSPFFVSFHRFYEINIFSASSSVFGTFVVCFHDLLASWNNIGLSSKSPASPEDTTRAWDDRWAPDPRPSQWRRSTSSVRLCTGHLYTVSLDGEDSSPV